MSRYRRPEEPPNSKCAKCGKAVWVRQDVHTMFHGKGYFNTKSEIQSYVHLKEGVICPECWEERDEQK